MKVFFTVFLFSFSFLFAQSYSSTLNLSLKDLESNKFHDFHNRFSAELKEKISVSQVQTIWLSLNIQLGGFVKMHEVDSAVNENGILYIVPMEFSKQWIDMKIHFNDSLYIDGLFFAPSQKKYPYILPSYADTSSFSQISIKIPVFDEFLNGFITLPKNKSKLVPVVILVHGSGPNDMDESIGPNKIFKDLAFGLASNGIAVIRYNKRTKELAHLLDPNAINFKSEVTDDVKSVVDLIKSGVFNIDTNQIYVLGHSLGGVLAPYIATENKIKGIILAGANARPLQDLIVDQVFYLNNLDGNFSDFEKKEFEQTKAKAAIISKNKFDSETPASQLLLGLSASYWRSLNNYSQIKVAQKLPVNVRILVLQGERDYQVTYKDDFLTWKKALQKRKDTHFIAYPSLNHLFLPGEGVSTPDEYEKYNPFFETTLIDIVNWIKN